MTKQSGLRIAVLMGGVSSEREISLRSGHAVARALEARGHVVKAIDVTSTDLGRHLKQEDFDVAFIALHGRFGEDGKVQQQCEKMGLAYTGSGPQASELALDKARSKELFLKHAIPTPEYRLLQGKDKKFWNTIDWDVPVVVKPPLEGSSIGLTIVRDKEDMEDAIAMAARYGADILVEQFITGREWTMGILAGQTLPIIEIVPKKGIYDYHSKYTLGETEYLVPAKMDEEIAGRIAGYSKKAFDILSCEDFGRVDGILAKDGSLWVLEVNTVPGFTETSLLPKAAAASGIDFGILCEKIALFGFRKSLVEKTS